MGILGDTLQWLSDLAIHVLQTTGYTGLLLLMAAESLVLPVPSEAVMPFAGILVAQGDMSWTGAILASSAGSMLGSWIGYMLGAYGFLPLVRRYGKYVLVSEHHVDAAHRWFEKRGWLAILVCRFVPGVRHVISIPAGSARMPMVPFLASTLVGATAWNVILLWLGYRYGLVAIHAMKPYMDLAAIAVALLLGGYLYWEWRKSRSHARAALAGGGKPPAV